MQPAGLFSVVYFVGVRVQCYVVCLVECNMCEKNVYVNLY